LQMHRFKSTSVLVRPATCGYQQLAVLAGGSAVGALLRFGFFVLLCCVFAGLRLITQRRLTEPFAWADDFTLPHREVRCAPQQNSLSIGSCGSFDRITDISYRTND
jgi:hypothetical protein